MNQEEINDVDRTPGFINAEGAEGISYASANQAFHAYLQATGKEKLPKKQKNQQFKKWLAQAKDSGQLDKVIAAGKNQAQKMIDNKRSQMNEAANTASTAINDDEPKKPTKILGMPPMVAVGVAVAAIGLISWGIYTVVKKNKKASA